MKNRFEKGALVIQLGLLILLTVISSAMLYAFFKMQFIRKVEDDVKNIEYQVYRTYIREYQRIWVVIQSLKQVDGSEGELEDNLALLKLTYGPEGDVPGLIKTISIYDIENPDSYLFLRDEAWETVVLEGNADEHNRFAPPLYPGEIEVIGLNEKGVSGSYIIHTPDEREELLIQVELDKEFIDETYVHPSLQEQFPNYDLSWVEADREDFHNDGRPLWFDRIRFRPLSSLIRLPVGKDIDLMIPVPDTIKTRHPFDPDKNDDYGLPPDNDVRNGETITQRKFPLVNVLQRDSDSYLVMGLDEYPFYMPLQRRWGLNWILSQAVLLGISLVVLVLILQMRRLKLIRTREKEFVASMTHELRTPLTVIRSTSDNLSQGIVPVERVPRYGEVIKEQADRLGSMVEEILLFSSLEGKSGKAPTPVPLDLNGICDRIFKQYQIPAEEKNIRLVREKTDFPEELKGYPGETELILSNLLGNAVLHAYPADMNNPGTIRIGIKVLVSGSIRITVEDEGQGIAAAEQKRIFDPFYRSAFSREMQVRGSGLGLFIAARKAELTGGTLKVESPYRRLDGGRSTGCRFILETPCLFEAMHNETKERN